MSSRIVRLVFRGEVAGLTGPLKTAEIAVKDTASTMARSSRESANYEQSLRGVESAAGKVAIGATALAGATVLAAADFDGAMSQVAAATHESAENMEALRAAALQAGAATVYSATEAAGAIEALAKAGVSTRDILAGGLSGALNLAASDGIEVASAAEIAASALTQFSLAGADVPHVADLLAAGAGKAQGGVADLGMALQQSGLVAAQTGLSIEETVGALAEFASVGLIGSDAGTAFKTMLQALTPNSAAAKAAIDKYNLSAYDAQGNFIGMTAFAGKLRDGLRDLSVEQQNATLKTIFGQDAIRAASQVFKDGAEGVQKWQTSVTDAGYAAETAAMRLDNLKGDVEQFKGSLETLLITSGDGAEGPLRKLTQGATDAVNALNGLPEPAKDTATALLGITAVTAGSLWFGSKVVRSIAETQVALTALNATASTSAVRLLAVGRAATFAGAAIGAGLVVDSFYFSDNTEDLDEFSRALLDAGKNTKATRSAIDELFKVSDGHGKLAHVVFGNYDLKGIQDAFRKITDEGPLGINKLMNSHQRDSAFNAFGKVDAALSALVQSGKTEAAADGFNYLDEQASKAGVSTGKLRDLLPQYRAAVDAAKEANTESAAAVAAQTDAVDEQKQALLEARAAAKDVAEQFVGLGKDVDNSRVTLDQWVKQREAQAKALEEFTANAAKATKRHVREGLIKELEEAGPSGALRLKQLADASDSEIRRANRAYVRGRRAVHEYQDAIAGRLPSAVNTDVTVTGVPVALNLLDQVITMFDKIPTDLRADVDVTTRHHSRSAYTRPPSIRGSGGDFTKGFAGGGYTGNVGIYEKAGDVHGREFVFDAQATEGNVSQLYALQDSLRRGVDIPTAAGQMVSANAGGIDMAELRALVASMQPMIGHQTVTPHNYNQFRREQEQVRRLASVGGRPSGGRG